MSLNEEVKNILKKHLDESLLTKCDDIYTKFQKTHFTGSNGSQAFWDKIDSYKFVHGIRLFDETTLSQFEDSLLTVQPDSDDEFDDGPLDDDLDIFGTTMNLTNFVTPPNSPRFESSYADDRKSRDSTPNDKRRRSHHNSPWKYSLGSPHANTPNYKKDESNQKMYVLERIASSGTRDLFDVREELTSEKHLEIANLSYLQHNAVQFTKKEVETEIKTEINDEMTDNVQEGPIDLVLPNMFGEYSLPPPTVKQQPEIHNSCELFETHPVHFKYMNWSHEENRDIVDEHAQTVIDSIKKSPIFLKEMKGLDLSEVNVDHASNQEAIFSGIIKDSDKTNSKLHIHTLTLVGLSTNNYREVSLRVGHALIKNFSLFVGQAVVVRGTNVTGTSIVATAIFTQSSLPLYNRQLIGLPEAKSVNNSLKVLYACGPFTSPSATDNFPLSLILEHTISQTPDVLFLSGPFVDQDHLMLGNKSMTNIPQTEHGFMVPIKSNTKPIQLNHTQTYESMFEDILLGIDERLSEAGVETKVVLIPSMTDAHHYCCLPQPPFAYRFNKEDKASSRFVFASNPSVIDVNGISFASTSQGSFLELGFQEISYIAPKSIDTPKSEEVKSLTSDFFTKRLVRLASHFISQQSLLPVSTLPIDHTLTSKANATVHLSYCPDIMFFPSKMKYFAERIMVPGHISSITDPNGDLTDKSKESFIAINTENSAKGAGVGYYAVINIAEGKDPVSERTQVEILRL